MYNTNTHTHTPIHTENKGEIVVVWRQFHFKCFSELNVMLKCLDFFCIKECFYNNKCLRACLQFNSQKNSREKNRIWALNCWLILLTAFHHEMLVGIHGCDYGCKVNFVTASNFPPKNTTFVVSVRAWCHSVIRNSNFEKWKSLLLCPFTVYCTPHLYIPLAFVIYVPFHGR